MIIVTIANQKGGVGKTTTAVTLAHGLAFRQQNVLLIDLDPQGQCATHLGLQATDDVFNFLVSRPPLRDVVKSTRRPRLWLMAGNKRTSTAQTIMVAERQPVDTLGRILTHKMNGETLDYVVIDTAPSVGGLQENALYAATILIIPTAVDHLALEGVGAVIKTLRALGRSPLPATSILPTFYDEVTRESTANLDRLEEAFPKRVMCPIHRASVLRECPALGLTIFEHDPRHRAAREYAKVVWAVVNA